MSVSHVAAISIDRLPAVIYPLRHKSIMESFGLKALLIVSWTSVAAIFALVRGIPDVSVTVRLRINLVAFTLCYAVVLISYTAIVICLVRQRKLRNQLRNGSSNNPTPPPHGAVRGLHPRDCHHRLYSLLVSTVCYLCCSR